MGLFNSKVDPFFPNPQQFRESVMPQHFSLPIPVMKYIWENPSSPVLIKCCKIFFIKNPILLSNNLEYCFNYKWRCCNSPECNYCCSHRFVFNERIKMGKIKNKIWVLKKFNVFERDEKSFVSNFIPKIYRCDIEQLDLYRQKLSYDELKFLAAGVKECRLWWILVRYDNGKVVLLENIIKLFSGAKKVYLRCDFHDICKSYDDFVEACNTVKEVELRCFFTNNFDVQKFYSCLKRSKNRALIKIQTDSFERHATKEVINEILTTASFDFVPPVIDFYSVNGSKMKEIQTREAAKYH